MPQLYLNGLAAVMTANTLFLIFIGVAVGIMFGAVPGLTATLAVILCLPLTFGMSPLEGISLLCGLYIGGISGGLITAILLKIPGTPSSIATTYDGAPMAKNGLAGKAIGVGVFYSFLGGAFGILCLVFISPLLASVTLKFGAIEYFAITVFSMTMVASLAGKSLIKGLMSAFLGLALTTIGAAPIDNIYRFTFGNRNLNAGFTIVSLSIGVFAIGEVLQAARKKYAFEIKSGDVIHYKIRGIGLSAAEFKQQFGNFIRSSVIGAVIGILPGIGGGVSNLIAYSAAKKHSRHPQKFGTGIIDGVIASEASNNAAIGGAMIPLLTLGIPGDTVTAMMLGGFLIHGITPGPMLFKTQGTLIYGIFAAMFIANLAMLFIELAGIRVFVKLLRIPKHILLPIIVVLCCVGAYGVNNRIFDVQAVAFFGLLGFVMQKLELPSAPLMLGFILGRTAETNLRRGLQLTKGDFLQFFTHPIAAGFMIISMLSIILTAVSYAKRRRSGNS